MWMIGTGIHLELLDHLASQAILWEHAPNSLFNESLRMIPANLLQRLGTETTGITRVAEVDLLCLLVTRHIDLVCVDNDDEITAVHVRSICRLALPTENLCDLR